MNITAGIFQFNPVFGDIKKNINTIELALKESAAGLIVLPELCTTGYQFRNKEELFKLAEQVPDGDTVKLLCEISKDCNNYIVFGMAEIEGGCLYNSAVLVGKGCFIGKYQKAHLFFEEKEIFSPGKTEFPVFSTEAGKIGLMVCFDWIFPEVSRILSLEGAQVICHPSNLVLPYCQEAMITRALENRVFVITANRTGKEDRKNSGALNFTGKSQITGPDGEMLFRMNMSDEKICTAVLELDKTENKNITEFNDLFNDRRTELYKKLLKST